MKEENLSGGCIYIYINAHLLTHTHLHLHLQCVLLLPQVSNQYCGFLFLLHDVLGDGEGRWWLLGAATGGGGGVGREVAAEATTDGEVKSEDSEEKKEESCRDEDNVEVEATSGRGGRGGAGPARVLELGEGRNSSS